MKWLFLASLVASFAAWAQAAPAKAPVAPETVVATVDGKQVTAAEIMSFLSVLPEEARKQFTMQPKAFLERYAMMKKFTELAEKAKLEEQSPYKEQLALQRMIILFQAEATEAQNQILVSGDEQKKFYEEHLDRYRQYNVKMIYVAFSSSENPVDKLVKKHGGHMYPTEAEAKAKAEKLLADLRAGADFVKLVKEQSDDATSVAKDGDFGTPIRRSDNVPEAIKQAIFALKPGEVSEPIQTAAGFHLLRAEEDIAAGHKSLDEVRDTIRDALYNEALEERFQQWLSRDLRERHHVEVLE